MGGDVKEKVISKDGKGSESGVLKLIEHTFETPRDKMPEMTNIPLDQIRPLSMMGTYEIETNLLCDMMVEAQKAYNKIWEESHPDAQTVEVEDWDKEKREFTLLMAEWRFLYYQHRRSIGGDHVKDAIVLAQDQIAAEIKDEETGEPEDW